MISMNDALYGLAFGCAVWFVEHLLGRITSRLDRIAEVLERIDRNLPPPT